MADRAQLLKLYEDKVMVKRYFYLNMWILLKYANDEEKFSLEN